MNATKDYSNFVNIAGHFLRNSSDYSTDSAVALDWNKIYAEFRFHSIETLAIDSIDDINIPPEIEISWKNDIILKSSHFLKILRVQEEITQCLNSNGIRWAVLKGLSAAIYYPNPKQRAIGDIDILVSEDDFSKAKDCLSKVGFVFANNIYTYDRHITARKNGIEIELHRFFANTRNKGNDKALNDMLFDSLSHCKTVHIDDVSFSSLPETETGLVFIEHIWHHIRTGIGLRQILDFIMFVDKTIDDEFWNDSFKEAAEIFGYVPLCKVIARVGQLYFGLDESIEWCKDIDDNLACEFLELVISQGDFGSKSSNSFNSTIRVLNKRNEGFRSFIKYEQASGMINWKAAQKNKLLRPFAWVYGLTRHIIITISNKNNIASLKSNQKQSRKQAELLNKLKSN